MRREQNTPAHRHKSVSSTSFQAGIERCRFPAHWSKLTLYRTAQLPPGSTAPSRSRLPNLSNRPAITSASADLSPHIALAFTLLPDQFPPLKSDKSLRDKNRATSLHSRLHITAEIRGRGRRRVRVRQESRLMDHRSPMERDGIPGL